MPETVATMDDLVGMLAEYEAAHVPPAAQPEQAVEAVSELARLTERVDAIESYLATLGDHDPRPCAPKDHATPQYTPSRPCAPKDHATALLSLID